MVLALIFIIGLICVYWGMNNDDDNNIINE